MVFVAERFRRKIVALVYAGSNPVKHPLIDCYDIFYKWSQRPYTRRV